MKTPTINSENIVVKKEGKLFRLWYTDETKVDIILRDKQTFPKGMGGLIDANTVLEGDVYIDAGSIVLNSRLKNTSVQEGSYVKGSDVVNSRINDSTVKKCNLEKAILNGSTLKKTDVHFTIINNSSIKDSKTKLGKIENIIVDQPTYLIDADIESEDDIARGKVFGGMPDMVCHRVRFAAMDHPLFSEEIVQHYACTFMYESHHVVLDRYHPYSEFLYQDFLRWADKDSSAHYLLEEQFREVFFTVRNALFNTCVERFKQKRNSKRVLQEFNKFAGTETLEEAAQYILNMQDYETKLTAPDFRVVDEFMKKIAQRSENLDPQLKAAVAFVDWAEQKKK